MAWCRTCGYPANTEIRPAARMACGSCETTSAGVLPSNGGRAHRVSLERATDGRPTGHADRILNDKPILHWYENTAWIAAAGSANRCASGLDRRHGDGPP